MIINDGQLAFTDHISNARRAAHIHIRTLRNISRDALTEDVTKTLHWFTPELTMPTQLFTDKQILVLN